MKLVRLRCRATKPLDSDLNRIVLQIGARLFPDGFDVSKDAPGSWDTLRAHLGAGKANGRFLRGIDSTIYGDPQVDYAFRDWHDHVHWINQWDFSVDGETAVCEEQCRVIVTLAKDEWQAALWERMLCADLPGQTLYQRLYGRFPEDQRGFAIAYTHSPDKALANV